MESSGEPPTFQAPEPIFAPRDEEPEAENFGPVFASSSRDYEQDILELPQPGLDNLKKICSLDNNPFKGPGQPWPLVGRRGQIDVDPALVQRLFCSSACARSWLDSQRDTTQADHTRLVDYASRVFGFKLCPGAALPVELLFKIGADGEPLLTIDEYRSYGDYFILSEEPRRAKIDEAWLRNPNIEALMRLENFRVIAANFYAQCLTVAHEPSRICFHHAGPLDDAPDETPIGYPLGSQQPWFLFCGFSCAYFWVLSYKHENRMLAIGTLRDMHLKKYKTMDLPSPAPDKTYLKAFNRKGLKVHRFLAKSPYRVTQQVGISTVELCTGNRVTRTAAQEPDQRPDQSQQCLPAAADALRDVMANFKTRGQQHFDHGQNSQEFEATGPVQTYRANGMTMRTFQKVPKKVTFATTGLGGQANHQSLANELQALVED